MGEVILKSVKIVLFVSDLLFPVWWILILIFLKRKGVAGWKAWGIASTFCVTQAYIVSRLVGWNLGAYFMIFIVAIPSILRGNPSAGEAFRDQLMFWVIPPIVLILLPTLILYLRAKAKRRKMTVE